jgi:hypothetical protein
MGKLELTISIDIDRIEKIIRKSKDLREDEAVFSELAWLMEARGNVDQLVEEWEDAERQIKQALNDKAKSLLGKDWSALDGDGFSLRRSLTGSVYQLVDPEAAPKEVLDVKIGVNSKAVTDYVKANSKLPDGLAYNPNRNESIRIKLI